MKYGDNNYNVFLTAILLTIGLLVVQVLERHINYAT